MSISTKPSTSRAARHQRFHVTPADLVREVQPELGQLDRHAGIESFGGDAPQRFQVCIEGRRGLVPGGDLLAQVIDRHQNALAIQAAAHSSSSSRVWPATKRLVSRSGDGRGLHPVPQVTLFGEEQQDVAQHRQVARLVRSPSESVG